MCWETIKGASHAQRKNKTKSFPEQGALDRRVITMSIKLKITKSHQEGEIFSLREDRMFPKT